MLDGPNKRPVAGARWIWPQDTGSLFTAQLVKIFPGVTTPTKPYSMMSHQSTLKLRPRTWCVVKVAPTENVSAVSGFNAELPPSSWSHWLAGHWLVVLPKKPAGIPPGTLPKVRAHWAGLRSCVPIDGTAFAQGSAKLICETVGGLNSSMTLGARVALL